MSKDYGINQLKKRHPERSEVKRNEVEGSSQLDFPLNYTIIILCKKTLYNIFLFLGLITVFTRSHTFALDTTNLPPLDNFVVDYTNTLTSSQIDTFASGAYNIQQQTSAQIAALIIPDRGSRELYDIALDVFRSTGIGDDRLNNGLLLIIAKDEKKLRLTVGYGLEGIIPDVLAREIVEQIRPLVDAGDMYGAVNTYYELVTPYIDGTGKARIDKTGGYQVTIRDQIWGMLFFIIMGSSLGSKRTRGISVKKDSSLSRDIITRRGTGGLVIIGFITFMLFPFGFFGALIGYIVGSITSHGQGFTMSSGRGRGYYGGGGFTGWGGGGGGFSGGFGGGFGGSSGGGGAGD